MGKACLISGTENIKKKKTGYWLMFVIPTLGRQRPEDQGFKGRLGGLPETPSQIIQRKHDAS